MALTEKGHNTGSGSAVISITGVTAGASLILAWTQVPTDVRTYTASSNVDGAFTSVVTYNSVQRRQGQFRLDNVTAGNHTITLQSNTGTTVVFAWVFEEPAGLTATVVTPTGSGNLSSSGNTHHSAPSGELDSASTAELVIVSCGTFSNTPTTTVAGASPAYTKATAASNARAFCQYRNVTNGPITDDRGEFTHTGSALTAEATMVIYEVDDGSGVTAAITGGWFGR